MSRTTIHPAATGFGARRRERERATREADILAAAERVVGRHGLQGAGMTEIAREAEYAIGTLYAIFESKEALYERLIVSRTEELVDAMQAALARPGSARDRLEAALDAKIEHAVKHLDFLLIYASTSVTGTCGWGAPERAEQLRARNQERIADVVRTARRKGELGTAADPTDVALAFQTLSTNFLLTAARSPRGFEPARVREAMRTVFFDPLFPRRAAAAGRAASRSS